MAKIQIIDDDVELAALLASSLKTNRHDVRTYNKTDGAVQELQRNKPDLLVLDVMFPEDPIGGFDLAREIRKNKELKTLPIIMLTGVNQHFPMDFSETDIDPAWLPVQEFIEKPAKVAVLLRKIDKLLKQASGTK